MIIGKSYTSKAEEELFKTKAQIYKLIPRKVFAWIPHRLENDGRKVWLQYVWKVTDSKFSYYYLDEYEAHKESYYRHCHYSGFNHNLRTFYKEINNIIGKRKDEIIEERVAELRKETNK